MYWFKKKPKLTSITPEHPGSVELLTKRTFLVNPLSPVFHVAMILAFIPTGLLLGVMYLSFYTGWGQTIFMGWGLTPMWAHGVVGLIAAIGFVGVFVRFSANRYFRLVFGKIFYVDTAFILVISISGIILFLPMIGLWSATSGWELTIHIYSSIVWPVISFLGDGMVKHAIATIVYRFNIRGSHYPGVFTAFSSACGRCGRCVEACPIYDATNERPEQAPALKVRKYLKAFKKEASLKERKSMAEDIYVCALCGLCVGVCPYSFRHYDLYMSLLAEANKLWKESQLTYA